jgi:hypothetical protein
MSESYKGKSCDNINEIACITIIAVFQVFFLIKKIKIYWKCVKDADENIEKKN